MERDRIKIKEIVKELLDIADFLDREEELKIVENLEAYIEQERIQAIGWMHAEACTTADRGEDIRETECSGMLERAQSDLNLVPSKEK